MEQPMPISMSPIGIIQTEIGDEDVSRVRRKIVSSITVFDEFAVALTGIENYSHLFVLFWMDRIKSNDSMLSYPHRDRSLPLTGVLASRGPNHPNAIGLAVVELMERNAAILTVRRLDAYDGTPVLDIKPYDHYDLFPDIQVPEWFRARAMARRVDPG